jgi:hypothetical protein
MQAIEAGRKKMRQYYSNTGGAIESVYALVTILDLSQKLESFSGPAWEGYYRSQYKKEFIDYFVKNYALKANGLTTHTPSAAQPQTLNIIF